MDQTIFAGAPSVFHFFQEICKLPHGSGNEKAVSDFIADFAASKGLEYRQDEVYNIVVKKPAAKGYETAPTIILQGHLDMVCEKNADTIHDFTKDPLSLRIDGDFISAEGTTLGADDGIAVAYMLAVLDDDTLPHPAVEAVFTVGEEVGMDGARALDVSDLNGTLFLNMDTEQEGRLLAGCCGGRRAKLYLPIVREHAPAWGKAFALKIRGLKGGHSGADIHLQRASANRLMGRVLERIIGTVACRLSSMDGGLMDNAICREATAVLVLSEADYYKAAEAVAEMEKEFLSEYAYCETSIRITLEPMPEKIEKVFTADTARKALDILQILPYGVQTMCLDMPGLVESSSNIGIVRTTDDYVFFDNALRSSVPGRKEEMYERIRIIARLTGAELKYTGEYPGWKYNPHSKLLAIAQKSYYDLFGHDAVVEAIHAGLECGIFADKIPGLDLLSIGPTMEDVHTPDEHLSISSTVRTWELLKEILKNIH